MKGFITDARQKIINEKTYIQLFGKLESGESFSSMHEFHPYLFIQESNLKKAKPLLLKFKIEKTQLTNFKGKKVIKISADFQADIIKLTSALRKKEIATYEADLKPTSRFIIDENLLSSVEISGESQPEQKVDKFFPEAKISPVKSKPSLKIISLDIESDKKFSKLYCVGLYSKNYKKNFMITNKKIPNVVPCKDEPELLQKLKDEIIKQDPDILTGWHVIDFDLMFLKKKFEEHRIPFDLGRTNENVRIRIASGFFKSSSAEVPGRQVLDALNLIKDPFIKEAPSIKNAKFNSYTLEDVSQALLNDGKLLKGNSRHNEIEDLFEKGKHETLAEYNIKDCKLVYDIIEKTKMIDLAMERSSLTGLPLNKLTSSIAAFDSLYIRKARKKGLVSPTTEYRTKTERITGGYVMNSQPGIYHNVLVLDFKSLYPSVIKTFNIDPASYLEKPTPKTPTIQTPNNAHFKNTDGVLPQIITKLHAAREKAKKEKRELSSYAIKIIMNSFFGLLASPNSRYFSLDIGNSITTLSQFIIKLTATEIEKSGYEVIYSDTDSVFIHTNLQKKEANALGKQIEKNINAFFKRLVKEKYDRESFLELEFEKQYLSFLLPPARGSEKGSKKGSKKRYAGLLEKNGKEEMQIVGLEAIRGDWTEAAQDFQRELLNKIFHKQEFVPFIRNYVKKINEGKIDKKLIYKKSIRKALTKYVKTTPPHVKAARKLDKLNSNIIKYYITKAGPEPVQKLKHKLDYKHYINKQIKPIANTILFFFDKDFDEIISSSKQMKLF